MGAGCACLSQALPEVICAPLQLDRRGLVLRYPLAVMAAMDAVCPGESDCAAVVDRESLRCGYGGVWSVAVCRVLADAPPTPPPTRSVPFGDR